jgi:AcrR family transcriptional regulator
LTSTVTRVSIPDVPVILPSAKEQIVLTAERLFAEHGVDGVSLRQIGAAAGNGNNSAVQYHFGSKERLIQAIFEYRLPELTDRRAILIAHRRPDDLRSWVECYVLPILELGEREGSNYLSFVAMLQQHGRRDIFARMPSAILEPATAYRDRMRSLLPAIAEPLRTHRVGQAMQFSVHAAADRERARAAGLPVLPFAVHVNDVLDGLVGFLEAPVSPATEAALAAMADRDPDGMAWPLAP